MTKAPARWLSSATMSSSSLPCHAHVGAVGGGHARAGSSSRRNRPITWSTRRPAGVAEVGPERLGERLVRLRRAASTGRTAAGPSPGRRGRAGRAVRRCGSPSARWSCHCQASNAVGREADRQVGDHHLGRRRWRANCCSIRNCSQDQNATRSAWAAAKRRDAPGRAGWRTLVGPRRASWRRGARPARSRCPTACRASPALGPVAVEAPGRRRRAAHSGSSTERFSCPHRASRSMRSPAFRARAGGHARRRRRAGRRRRGTSRRRRGTAGRASGGCSGSTGCWRGGPTLAEACSGLSPTMPAPRSVAQSIEPAEVGEVAHAPALAWSGRRRAGR